MSNKAKGSRVERELLDLFTKETWKAARVAGSGTNDNTFCDLIAGKEGKKAYAIEIKSSKSNRIYITKQQIDDFMVFSDIMGLTPVIAVRFNREGWLFLHPQKLEDSGKYWVVSLERARTHGHKFSQFFEKEARFEEN